MALEITGKVVKVLPEQTGKSSRTGNDWKKGSFVIETESSFPKKVCFTAWGDLTSQVNNLKTGQNIKVSFDVESREFNERWYSDLKAWKIDPASDSAPVTGGHQTGGSTITSSSVENFPAETPDSAESSSDDLPF